MSRRTRRSARPSKTRIGPAILLGQRSALCCARRCDHTCVRARHANAVHLRRHSRHRRQLVYPASVAPGRKFPRLWTAEPTEIDSHYGPTAREFVLGFQLSIGRRGPCWLSRLQSRAALALVALFNGHRPAHVMSGVFSRPLCRHSASIGFSYGAVVDSPSTANRNRRLYHAAHGTHGWLLLLRSLLLRFAILVGAQRI